MKSLRKFALAAVPACVLALGSVAAHAGTIQLGFILDRSGSIGQTDWNIIVNGLSSAISTLIPVGGADTYEISVVTFSDAASININSVVVDSLAGRSALATSIAGLTTAFTGGTTNFSDALSKMKTALTDNVGTPGYTTAASAAASYVNFATDGVPNVGGTGNNGEFATARTALITAGVDNISVEGIGSGVDPTLLKNQVCYPTPCDATSPYDFPNKGFYIAVANAAAYKAAIENKIRVVTNQVIPEPASLALVGLALLGAGAASRRKAVAKA